MILLQRVLYHLINRFNVQCGDPRIRPSRLSVLHAVVLSAVLSLYVAWIIYDIITYYLESSSEELHYGQFVVAKTIVFLIPSLEIMTELFIIFWYSRNTILFFKVSDPHRSPILFQCNINLQVQLLIECRAEL